MPDDEMTTAEKDELLHPKRSKAPCSSGGEHRVPEGTDRCADCGAPVAKESEAAQ
jgi:hypothetical protein